MVFVTSHGLHLRLEQYRPLLLAVLRSFAPKEIEKTLAYLVSCSVRFLIHGGLGGGTLEKNYCDCSLKVLRNEITTAKDLALELNSVVPSDAHFKDSFATFKVSKAYLSRYYLQTLERIAAGGSQPELVPNPNPQEVNLEHVLPQNPSDGWGKIEPDVAEVYFNRFGNLALLQQSINNQIGNQSFSDKKAFLQQSSFSLTQKIALRATWDAAAIDERQSELAEFAVSAWPLNV